MRLLPKIEEIKPINNHHNLFYECGFNTSFENLSFQQKLQVVCDIVRQTIFPNGFPNPDTDIYEMNGNCYTSSFCFINYLKKINLGKNLRCALVRKRYFDPEEITSIHVVALVDAQNGHTYQIDTTPFVGYKYGSVIDITNNRTYEEYVVINEIIEFYLYNFRKIIYDNSINKFNYSKINEYLDLCQIAKEIPILKGYASVVLKIINKHIKDPYEMGKIQNLINLYQPFNSNNPHRLKELKEKLNQASIKWLEELNDLRKSNSNLRRQQELAINITQENKWTNESLERRLNINGECVRISCLNPRLFFECNYHNLIRRKNQNVIESIILDSKNRSISAYDIDLATTKREGIIISELTSLLSGKNYNESSNCCESVLNFLIGYPEHQSMIKYMYPNPMLLKK